MVDSPYKYKGDYKRKYKKQYGTYIVAALLCLVFVIHFSHYFGYIIFLTFIIFTIIITTCAEKFPPDTLDIVMTDTFPVANADANSIAEDTISVTGNAVTRVRTVFYSCFIYFCLILILTLFFGQINPNNIVDKVTMHTGTFMGRDAIRDHPYKDYGRLKAYGAGWQKVSFSCSFLVFGRCKVGVVYPFTSLDIDYINVDFIGLDLKMPFFKIYSRPVVYRIKNGTKVFDKQHFIDKYNKEEEIRLDFFKFGSLLFWLLFILHAWENQLPLRYLFRKQHINK